MHWVDRGEEPPHLEEVRDEKTQKWVRYYRLKEGSKPSDSNWRDFHIDVRDAFFGLCAFCEVECNGEVEHFRPKSKFPELVYQWTNWLFACHDCNHAKSNKWPAGGYVDPCTEEIEEHPETYFEFDLMTGEIVPKSGLSNAREKKARTMVKDLKLNNYHHLKKRLRFLNEILDRIEIDATLEDFVSRIAARDYPYSSIARQLLVELGFSSLVP